MGRVARQPLLCAAQRARECLGGRVIYGSSLAALTLRPCCFETGGSRDFFEGAKRCALKGACRTMTPQTALAKHQRCGMDKPVMKTKSHAGMPYDDAEGPVLLQAPIF